MVGNVFSQKDELKMCFYQLRPSCETAQYAQKSSMSLWETVVSRLIKSEKPQLAWLISLQTEKVQMVVVDLLIGCSHFFFLFWQHRYWGIIHIHSIGHLKWRTPWFLLCSLHWAAITTDNFRIEIPEQSNLLCFAYSGDFLLIESHNMWSSVIGFFPLASCLQGSSML